MQKGDLQAGSDLEPPTTPGTEVAVGKQVSSKDADTERGQLRDVSHH